MSTNADYTLDDLWERGVQALQQEDARPGTTYEVAPGIVGEMPYPTLETRKKSDEIREELKGTIFRSDASPEDFSLFNARRQKAQLAGQDADVEAVEEEISKLKEEGAESPIPGSVSTGKFNRVLTETNCRRTCVILDFDGKEVEAHDIVPEMASVVTAHFTKLGPSTPNGQRKS